MKVSIAFARVWLLLAHCHMQMSVFHAPIYVPTRAELAQINLAHVLYYSNDAYADDWQSLFVLVGLEVRLAGKAMRGCVYRVRVAGLIGLDELVKSAPASQLRALSCTLSLDSHCVGECHLAVPSSLVLLGSRRLVALTAEVQVEGGGGGGGGGGAARRRRAASGQSRTSSRPRWCPT